MLSGWERWRQEGLTEHRNWWPAAYAAYCAANQCLPDPAALAYAVDYSSVRADLKDVSGSA